MQSGFASSIAFFIFPNVTESVMSGFVLVSSVMGVAGYGAVIVREKNKKKNDASEEHAGLLSEDQ